jgi:cyclophilin family peptidyl-prolyl cis-trans isomerase
LPAAAACPPAACCPLPAYLPSAVCRLPYAVRRPPSAAYSRYGRAGLTEPNSNQPYGEPFDPDNYRILHSYREAGVISMMKDLTNKGKLDSRFFITFSPYASWADSKYEAFGRVSKGMDLISAIQIVPVEPPSNYPKSRIEIVDSGCY